jgi:hypothetical protein
MKLKHVLLLTLALQTSLLTFAQLKIKDGGRIGIGTNDVSWFKTNISAPYGVMALNLRNTTPQYGYISRAQVSNAYTKSWVVTHNGRDNFFVYGEGKMYYKNGWQWSDETLKENIYQIEDAIDKIKELRGVYYTYKTDGLSDSAIGGTEIIPDEKQYMGLIAQEVEEIVPEVVTEDDNGIKAVAYENLVALLIEGMKEQQAKIEEMQTIVFACCGMSFGSRNNTDTANSSTQQNQQYNKAGITEQNTNKLHQNNPNPFNQNTTIEYEIANSFNKAVLYVYNYQGEQLKFYPILSAGKGSISVKASDFKPGIYFYDLIIDNKAVGTKKMILTE